MYNVRGVRKWSVGVNSSAPASRSTQTRILPVEVSRIGKFHFTGTDQSFLEDWDIELDKAAPSAAYLSTAAENLRNSDVPVAFPTETVYGLGADATRSSAVLGIYKAKQRPADNPLIVHVCSLAQLRSLLRPQNRLIATSLEHLKLSGTDSDPIPQIYHTLIRKFWPGPLTILLPNPESSALASEVTAGLPTFGARMPASLLGLALIKLANVPIAAPSANASTKPSPTTAEHVLHDLNGRIDLILDGGPCNIGVESTVVDGLSSPPLILRPGGVSIDQLRECPGWEDVQLGYKDASEQGMAPKAPGMKYKHYSPKAKVVLVEPSAGERSSEEAIWSYSTRSRVKSIGILRTKHWKSVVPEKVSTRRSDQKPATGAVNVITNPSIKLLRSIQPTFTQDTSATQLEVRFSFQRKLEIWDIGLGQDPEDIARSLFAGLRELDLRNVDIIFVEGIHDGDRDATAAIMNRLRKAAEVEITT
ncbi:MAG: hypothetical protein MMC33_003925 [Icmadophila ericetorum]|nr:hypothetical protein [Icmadophila ericetorum]